MFNLYVNSGSLAAAAWSTVWRVPGGMGSQQEEGLGLVSCTCRDAGVENKNPGAVYLPSPHDALFVNQFCQLLKSERWVFKFVPQRTVKLISFFIPFSKG